MYSQEDFYSCLYDRSFAQYTLQSSFFLNTMNQTRPEPQSLIGQDKSVVPLSAQRVLQSSTKVDTIWVGPDQSTELSSDVVREYELAHTILKYIAIEAPRKHKSGHPGGPLSAFTFCYGLLRHIDPKKDCKCLPLVSIFLCMVLLSDKFLNSYYSSHCHKTSLFFRIYCLSK